MAEIQKPADQAEQASVQKTPEAVKDGGVIAAQPNQEVHGQAFAEAHQNDKTLSEPDMIAMNDGETVANSVLVRRSDSADIEIYDQRDNFIASRKSGEWHGKLLFNDFELEEFTLIENDAEIESILTEARAALNRPFVVASDQAAKSA